MLLRFNPWKGLVMIVARASGDHDHHRGCFNPWKGLVMIVATPKSLLNA